MAPGKEFTPPNALPRNDAQRAAGISMAPLKDGCWDVYPKYRPPAPEMSSAQLPSTVLEARHASAAIPEKVHLRLNLTGFLRTLASSLSH